MTYKVIDAEQIRWRAAHAPHLVALVRVGAVVHKGKLLERPIDITPTASCSGWTAIPPTEYGPFTLYQTTLIRGCTRNHVHQTRCGSVTLGTIYLDTATRPLQGQRISTTRTRDMCRCLTQDKRRRNEH